MRAIAGLLLALVATGAGAASLEALSPAGTYALDRKACSARDYFATLTDETIDLMTYSCTGVRYDQIEKKGARALYQVKAASCIAGEETQGRPDAFRIERISSTIRILWADGTKSAKLVRCGK